MSGIFSIHRMNILNPLICQTSVTGRSDINGTSADSPDFQNVSAGSEVFDGPGEAGIDEFHCIVIK